MENIIFRVRGTHTASVPAERGTVHAQISLEGPDLVSVMSAVTGGQTRLVRLIEELHDKRNGPVTWYAVDQLSTHSWTPRDRDNQPLAPMHSASISVEVKFSDFSALPVWVRDAVGINGFSVDRVQWDLTAKRRALVEAKTRQRAVHDARDRAQNYADALECGPVRLRSLSESGLGFGHAVDSHRMTETIFDGAIGSGPAATGGTLVPRHIDVRAGVDVEFVLGV